MCDDRAVTLASDRTRLPLRIANPTPVQRVYRRLAGVVGWFLGRLTDQDWDDASGLPREAGVIVVSNHISYFDPPCLAHYLIWHGRWPRALGKSDLWRVPVLGAFARATGQIPVERNTDRAADALGHAREALAAGECVVIYPEGTITADPDTWPMTPRRGAALLALQTSCPVVPVGQWGAHAVMPGRKPVWPRFRPRRTVVFRAGDPVDLADLAGRTDVAAVTALVARIRGEEPPDGVFDIRVGRRVARRSGR